MHPAKRTILAIAVLCGGCTLIPVPAPIPIPIETNPTESTTPSIPPRQNEAKLDEKYKNTCYADGLTEIEGRATTGDSGTLEGVGDKLAAAGKHQEAIRKHNEASAALLNESVKDGSLLEMEIDALFHNKEETEEFKKKHRPLVQKSAESNFKIGRSYVALGKYENAIDCFDSALKIGILPPNDATTYLNRGDAYEKIGNKAKAKANFQQAVILFKKHKQPAYQKIAEQRLLTIK
ncbi:MAG: tetratricopeptide repeat protein [Microcoleus sp. PH2017_10_PVI_O_A]|uniref:tetratricopeptide repeat protein n=1 Tax=unclassified Microcoleus TaxID=2642155 RepID=UPI001D6FD76B|nr:MULTISPECIES: tetratricopeptide repeat protein [unclassified Microcoleus]MCC3410101.1 tetratricopeptide repeat protein [Microcoleus sp. PH2017_10_PVI_O_A]MCC3464362.1 tetratricopeptide repeat protein [Microcoleus sp. PH2017_11_PCY_U_A]MCC3482703.1 tetratricopeptide repeat protein [Microcoleus sp. PH2017_12_PCY_D_A]MCC3532525.1 tetratricopeptide repeat protein [Microcoleus sp. PH2017_21_RUC_O_A]MCC3544800.1 tetratricopeptide repeat protein [Microcoleus sp. PH2017_22_RUC_O_B]